MLATERTRWTLDGTAVTTGTGNVVDGQRHHGTEGEREGKGSGKHRELTLSMLEGSRETGEAGAGGEGARRAAAGSGGSDEATAGPADSQHPRPIPSAWRCSATRR